MRSKIFGAVLLGAAVALAGCSGGNNGSSSTGTSGTNGTPTSTSSGSTGNGSGSTGSVATSTSTSGSSGATGACSTNFPQGTCSNYGETCQHFTKQSNAHVVECACTTPNNDPSATADSCAGNPDGKTVCDEFTLTCRLPRSFEAANLLSDGGISNNSCDFNNGALASVLGIGEIVAPLCNYGVTNGQCDPVPADAGANPPPAQTDYCLQMCEKSSDCPNANSCSLSFPVFTLWSDGGVATFPDGGEAVFADGGFPSGLTPVGICDLNVCGAGASDDGGTLNGDYFGTCDAHGTGDGECLPILSNGAGLCYSNNASATDKSECDPSLYNSADSNGCALGAFCYPYNYLTQVASAPNDTGICLQMCNADAPDAGVYDQTCNTAAYTRGCGGFGSDDPLVSGGGLQPGVCVP